MKAINLNQWMQGMAAGTILLVLLSFEQASQTRNDNEIRLLIYPAHEQASRRDHLIAIKWCMAYLGSTLTSDKSLQGITVEDSVIALDIEQLGFKPYAVEYLRDLHRHWKKSKAYKAKQAMDLGRYISLTLGYSNHYFNLVGIPKKLKKYTGRYSFAPEEGLVDSSSVSLVWRIIAFANNHAQNQDFFLATETDSISREVLEFETLEVMENGLPKFGIYSASGKRKESGTRALSNAGKPAKCLWCHESQILPLFRQQRDWDSYLSYEQLEDSLEMRVERQLAHQDTLWKDLHFLKRWNHEKVEVAYISFMEPSAKRLAMEWRQPLEEVKKKLKDLKTHRHHEFDFLGDLYHRDEVDDLGPWKVVHAPESVRELTR